MLVELSVMEQRYRLDAVWRVSSNWGKKSRVQAEGVDHGSPCFPTRDGDLARSRALA